MQNSKDRVIKHATGNSPFWMVYVEGMNIPPTVQHKSSEKAASEAYRLAQKEGKRAWVMAPVMEFRPEITMHATPLNPGERNMDDECIPADPNVVVDLSEEGYGSNYSYHPLDQGRRL